MSTQSVAIKDMVRTLFRHSPGITSALRKLSLAARYHAVAPGNLSRVNGQLSRAWMNDGLPGRQREMVEKELAAYRAGRSMPVFDALVDILVHNIAELEKKSLLEIGCSSGYYSEVLQRAGVGASYRGCDFSPAFIRLARQKYPAIPFDVEDATRLSYNSSFFDIVVSGCCLLHIPEYESAIAEAARVSREFVVFHRTPVLHLSGPAYYTKKGYGVEMLEIHFHEQQLVRMFAAHCLHIVDINSHLCLPQIGRDEPLVHKTYLCRKAN